MWLEGLGGYLIYRKSHDVADGGLSKREEIWDCGLNHTIKEVHFATLSSVAITSA